MWKRCFILKMKHYLGVEVHPQFCFAGISAGAETELLRQWLFTRQKIIRQRFWERLLHWGHSSKENAKRQLVVASGRQNSQLDKTRDLKIQRFNTWCEVLCFWLQESSKTSCKCPINILLALKLNCGYMLGNSTHLGTWKCNQLLKSV